ncbi:urease accessory protein UreF [Aquabacterium sp.]|uniref:urease accessory protein UreF n=1 Tax=Aquabacterium sp. TaxID=1872578 RepID=UPI002CEF0940|nr:urease accessory UreF family protein [Aquabacterium sp.]HSW04898.1 urease accessory UreF family protein [Aquabacterium sp.]
MSSLLALMRLASPALPVGGFSYSDGLEAAVDAGEVSDETSALHWLLQQLQLTQQRAELPLVAAAFQAWQAGDVERITALNDWVMQTRETRELRLQTEQMGRSLSDWLRQRQPGDERVAALRALKPAPAWAVAFALAGVHSGAPLAEVLQCSGFAWAENMVQAALKAVPLGQSAGQRLLDALTAALPGTALAALVLAEQGDAARQSFAPMFAILSARHEAQYSRLFRS